MAWLFYIFLFVILKIKGKHSFGMLLQYNNFVFISSKHSLPKSSSGNSYLMHLNVHFIHCNDIAQKKYVKEFFIFLKNDLINNSKLIGYGQRATSCAD